jgi:hypothetical protein
MNITYNWVLRLVILKDLPNKPSAVVEAYWSKVGTTEDGKKAVFHGHTTFESDLENQTDFIPYSEVYENDELVLDWVKAKISPNYMAAIDNIILSAIVENVEPVFLPTSTWPIPLNES